MVEWNDPEGLVLVLQLEAVGRGFMSGVHMPVPGGLPPRSPAKAPTTSAALGAVSSAFGVAPDAAAAEPGQAIEVQSLDPRLPFWKSCRHSGARTLYLLPNRCTPVVQHNTLMSGKHAASGTAAEVTSNC